MDFTHNEIGQTIAYDFMRYFWDSQRALDFGAIAGRACPSQYNFAIEYRNQPEKELTIKHRRGFGQFKGEKHNALGIVIVTN